MQSFASGRLEKAFELELAQERAQQRDARDQVLPGHALVGIEIEDQPVGPVEARTA
jgi:hypothetical protein